MRDWKDHTEPKKTNYTRNNIIGVGIAALLAAAGYYIVDNYSEKPAVREYERKVMTPKGDASGAALGGSKGIAYDRTVQAHNGKDGDYVIDMNKFYKIEHVAVENGDKVDSLLKKYNPGFDFGNDKNSLDMRDVFYHVNDKEITDFLDAPVISDKGIDKTIMTSNQPAQSAMLRAGTIINVPVLVATADGYRN
jgi:hypothetical protein